MKRTKLLTSLAALALVLGLGACEVNVDMGDVNVGDVDVGVDVNPNDSSEPDEGGTTDSDSDTNPGTGEGGEGGDTGGEGGDTGTGGDGDQDPNTGDAGGDTGTGSGDGSGDGSDEGEGTGEGGNGGEVDNTETETLYISELDYLCFEIDGTDDYIYGKTYEYLTSCNVTFDTGDFTNTRWSSGGFIRLYENATITFTPKGGHKLVGLSVTWGSNTTSKAISIVDNAATVVNSDTGAEITDIVDGSQPLTVKNAGGSSEQLYFGNVVITYY